MKNKYTHTSAGNVYLFPLKTITMLLMVFFTMGLFSQNQPDKQSPDKEKATVVGYVLKGKVVDMSTGKTFAGRPSECGQHNIDSNV